MSGKHWSEDELLDRLYGVGPDDEHLSVCTECDGRMQKLAARRSEVVSSGETTVDQALLRRQRAAVMDRIERSDASFISWRAVTAFAGATAMILGFVVYHPQRSKPVVVQTVTQTASSDTQFFSEIYSEVEQTEPRAVRPMRRLFQEHP